mgnify:CR=1 FL=1|jgi:hypothetical protein
MIGLSGWAESGRGSDTAVQKGVNKNRRFSLAPQVDYVMLDYERLSSFSLRRDFFADGQIS